MSVIVQPLQPQHWPDVERIYRAGIETGVATLETDTPAWEIWDRGHVETCRFVALDGDCVLGWAALSPVSGRCVYQGVGELSVYVDTEVRGRGVGRLLLSHLVIASEQAGFWTLQAGIYVKNTASIALHKRCGFREVGIRERIGRDQHGVWWDVMLMERRSALVGVD